MKKNIWKLAGVLLLILGFSVSGNIALAAKKDSNPAGWSKGEKKGWTENTPSMPPGLEKKSDGKDIKKLDKNSEDEKNEIAKTNEKQKKKARKEAKQKKKKADKEAKKKEKAEKKAKQKKEKADKKALEKGDKEASSPGL